MTFRRLVATSLVAAALGLVPALPAFAIPVAAPATPTGAACGPNEGVTVVVDFTPTADDVVLGCAAGAQTTILEALSAVGFEPTTEVTGFGTLLCAIDGVVANPAGCQLPGPYWSLALNTTDGNPTDTGATFGTTWVAANVGVDGGPLAVGSVVGFSQGEFPVAPPRVDLATLPQPDNAPVAPPSYGPATGDATAAAGWIGRQLAAGDGLINGDAGLTVDAIYTLAAAGVGADVITQSAQALYASGASYIGTTAEIPARFGRIAKMVLALQIAGLDPSAFPDGADTRDLPAELRSVLNADGSFGSSDTPFVHAFALIALSRTQAGAPDVAVEWLAAQQCADPVAAGAFGFDATCASADPDYTAIAVQGLLAAGVEQADPIIAAAIGWLSAQQSEAGDVAGNTNSTGLVGQVFAAVGATEEQAAASGFIGGLQVSCDTVAASAGALVDDNVGAIAWTPESLGLAIGNGIAVPDLGEWQYASVQAVFGLGTPTLGALTAAGADAALPAATVCVAPTSETVPTTPPTSAEVTPSATTVSTSTSSAPAKPGLAVTGVDDRIGVELGIAALLLAGGAGLVVAGRRRGGHRKH